MMLFTAAFRLNDYELVAIEYSASNQRAALAEQREFSRALQLPLLYVSLHTERRGVEVGRVIRGATNFSLLGLTYLYRSLAACKASKQYVDVS